MSLVSLIYRRTFSPELLVISLNNSGVSYVAITVACRPALYRASLSLVPWLTACMNHFVGPYVYANMIGTTIALVVEGHKVTNLRASNNYSRKPLPCCTMLQVNP